MDTPNRNFQNTNRRDSQPRPNTMQRDAKPDADFAQVKHWVTTDIDAETLVFADSFGKELAKPIDKNGRDDKEGALTTSQIRTFFGEMRRIEMSGYEKNKTDFLMLKPKLAYASKRHNKIGIDRFYKFLCEAHPFVNSEQTFKNFMRLMEAVLAYHKFYGGK